MLQNTVLSAQDIFSKVLWPGWPGDLSVTTVTVNVCDKHWWAIHAHNHFRCSPFLFLLLVLLTFAFSNFASLSSNWISAVVAAAAISSTPDTNNCNFFFLSQVILMMMSHVCQDCFLSWKKKRLSQSWWVSRRWASTPRRSHLEKRDIVLEGEIEKFLYHHHQHNVRWWAKFHLGCEAGHGQQQRPSPPAPYNCITLLDPIDQHEQRQHLLPLTTCDHQGQVQLGLQSLYLLWSR